MLNRLLCFLLGHKFSSKATTGNTMEITNYLTGNSDKVAMYKWEMLQFCPRCCAPNPRYSDWKKMSKEWQDLHTEKTQ